MKIGLSLSGGGFRATVFHLGVLARLAESKQLESVSFLSTVSGGSLCMGLVHAANGFKWPSSDVYLARVLPEARRLLTTKDLQRGVIWRQLLSFWTIFDTRADDVSALLNREWGITARLAQLPDYPRWIINAACYETGKDWRFERFRMGDYVFGYSYDTAGIPLSDALAASSGFPVLIGPLVLDTRPYKWFRYIDRGRGVMELQSPAEHAQRKTEPVPPRWPSVHLWDGGAYDNYGLEGLTDIIMGWRADVEFLLISDGAGRAGPEAYRPGFPALMRLISGIMMDQVRSLRARSLLERLINHKDPGAFLQIGNNCDYVLTQARRAAEQEQPGSFFLGEAEIAQWASTCLSADDADRAAAFPTVIRSLTSSEYELLFRHGFEVADYTLTAYHPNDYHHIDYAAFQQAHPERP